MYLLCALESWPVSRTACRSLTGLETGTAIPSDEVIKMVRFGNQECKSLWASRKSLRHMVDARVEYDVSTD